MSHAPTATADALKACSECRETKPAADFLPSSASPDGLTARCKRCVLDGWRVERERRAGRVAEAKRRAHASQVQRRGTAR